MKVSMKKYLGYPSAESRVEAWWFEKTRDEYNFLNGIDESEWTMIDKIVIGSAAIYERFIEFPFHWVLDKLTDIPMFRRVKVRIDPWDTYSMDGTLSYIILPMLIQLKATKHGAPYVDVEDVPEELHPDSTPDRHGTDSTHFDRWDWVLDEMIFAFEHKIKESEGDEDYELSIEDTKQLMERTSNGFKLFGKYYNGLWD